MKQNLKTKIGMLFGMLLYILIAFSPAQVSAASVGEALTTPEKGWMRIDDADINATYSSGWGVSSYVRQGYSLYKGSAHYTRAGGASLKFNFYGTKIRIIDIIQQNRASNNSITIDGVTEKYSANGVSEVNQAIVFEKMNLPLGYHTVTISSGESGYYLQIDAIDIDDNGIFLNINTPLDLKANPGDSLVTLNWKPVDLADSYTVKYGTESGKYTETVTATKDTFGNFVIPSLTNGTKYYFVVSATVKGKESSVSNEAIATPQGGNQPPKPDPTSPEPVSPNPTSPDIPTTPQEPSDNRAILVVTMTTGLEKEFDLSMKEVNEFIAWYESKQAGSGPASFAINKHDNNKGPFSSRKDYMLYDRILTFEVSEYSK
ncbi:fibronectin type III domain-containing protein [Paenibacillus polymyxa]|uniref:fibronectin type III domain-containing protein n=1 Tax=Paenibacillus polymyxa TaxID=1406 RepID=UPI0004DF71C2|nr:fibronectin type III domain-containing protein [Paenibacillus polymyxa]